METLIIELQIAVADEATTESALDTLILVLAQGGIDATAELLDRI